MSSNNTCDTTGGNESSYRVADSVPAPQTRKRHSGHDSGQPCSSNSASAGVPGSSSSASDLPSTSTGKKSSELRFLTDFFPDQDVQSGPLTRSRTRNVEHKEGKSTSRIKSASRSSTKKTRSKKNRVVAVAPTEEAVRPRSPTPDPSSSNLTVAGSEVSGFSVTSSFTSDVSVAYSSVIDSSDLRNVTLDGGFIDPLGDSGEVVVPSVIMTALPTGSQNAPGSTSQSLPPRNFGSSSVPSTSRDNEEVNPITASTASQFLSRSQHVQRASAFLGSLVPRMQHLLGGATSSPNSSGNAGAAFSHNPSSDYMPHLRVISLIDELRSDNEIRQSEACAEISDMLLLGNEESLPNFPIRELILCLVTLLNKDHNFELMLSASRCITNLQEALPRSHTILIEAIPVLLQKLKRIEYIDVAEQALVILEVISRRNAKNILAAHGVQSVISHVDFFSLPTQRLAFQIAANCACFVTISDFHMVQDCLADLTQRLHVDDKRCVESICTFFNRLIENMRFYPHRLRQIAGKNHELLQVFQHLLIAQPIAVTSNTFISLLKSLRYMCANCGDLSVALFYMDFSSTLRYLLVGNERKGDQQQAGEVTIRPAQQLREIVDLIGELLPKLPQTGIFEINPYLEQYANPTAFLQNSRNKNNVAAMSWMYQSAVSDGSTDSDWRMFSSNDQASLERNRSLGATVMTLEMNGQLCEIDFGAQICRIVSSGVEMPIQRRTCMESEIAKDERDSLRTDNAEPFLEFVAVIFPLLVEIGSNSTCSNLRYDCLRVMLRMVFAVDGKDELLKFLKDVPLAAYISNTLSSSKNIALVTLAVQLVNILLLKLPNLYIPLFEAEGVFFELKKRAVDSPLKKSLSKTSSVSDSQKAGSSDCLISSSSSSRSVVTRTCSLKNPDVSNQLPIDNTHANTPAVAALGRLLTSQQHVSSTQSLAVLNQHLSMSNLNSMNSLPTLGLNSQAVDHQISSVVAAAVSGASTGSHIQAPSFLRYNTETASINRSVVPNLLFSVGPLQSPATSLYQTLTSAVSSAYAHPVYGLSYGGNGLTPSIDSLPPNFSSPHISSSTNGASLKAAALQRLETFIRTESASLTLKYDADKSVDGTSENMTILKKIAESLVTPSVDQGLTPLNDLCDALMNRELSAFQINYSGVISSLIVYLCDSTNNLVPDCHSRLRRFSSVFMHLNSDNVRPLGGDEQFVSFNRLISKVILAVERVEQFSVRITNLSGNLSTLSGSSFGSGSNTSGLQGFGSGTYLRGAQALRFFQSHQIRCNLRRHPSCKQLREWRRGRGSIKVDPFTSISAIERYLIDRGIGTTAHDEESSENDEVSDEEQDASYSSLSSFKGRIEILIGENRLPSDISILQAIRQFSLPQEDEDQETIPPSIWVAGHTLYYRAVVEDEPSSTITTASALSSVVAPSTSKDTLVVSGSSLPSSHSVSSSHQSSSKKGSRTQRTCVKKLKDKHEKRTKDDKKDRSFFNDGKVPKRPNQLERYLIAKLEHEVDDPCQKGLILLKALYGLNVYWWCLYLDEHIIPTSHSPILSQSCFYSPKLNSKVSRQLSDFLTVATQQIPRWTKNVVKAVPFIFPFTTRRNFLYCTAFGRDRALMHLVNEANPDDHDTESTSRLVPRLERRKMSINRTTLLKDAQNALNQLGSSRPLLEVGFDGEVGTGFGPTLEFYSTLSREIQKQSIHLWHGNAVKTEIDGGVEEYTVGENGLYPVITRHVSSSRSLDSRVKRFEFVGRLMAQTLLDSRILDIPFSPPLFKWLLGEQDTLGLADLEQLEPTIYNSLRQIGKLEEDDFESFEMYFTYPGNDNFELMKSGKSKMLKYENYRRFVDLICYWRLVEGVRADMEALRRGFQQAVNSDHLKIFDASEMEGLFCGSSESADEHLWTRPALQQAIRPDHGYTHDSTQIGWLVDMLHLFTREERRKFLQFVTGSPRLPVGGFRALHPPLTVVRKTATCGSTEMELPSAMTCYNYLKIPPYESYDIFRERFEVALQYIYSFHLT